MLCWMRIIGQGREKSIKDLETQKRFAAAADDKRELEQKIAYLKSIKWWQFWRSRNPEE